MLYILCLFPYVLYFFVKFGPVAYLQYVHFTDIKSIAYWAIDHLILNIAFVVNMSAPPPVE